MLLDDVDDALIEFVLEREIDAFLDVRDDDERAHGRREIVVRVALEVHVLGEVFRLHQFADVVKIGEQTRQSVAFAPIASAAASARFATTRL